MDKAGTLAVKNWTAPNARVPTLAGFTTFRRSQLGGIQLIDTLGSCSMNRYPKFEPRNIRLDTVTRIIPIIMKKIPITSYDLSVLSDNRLTSNTVTS